MIPIYIHRHTVSEREIDRQGHVNNVAYVRWMQDAAVAHSAAVGWPLDRYLEQGWAWVVRSHYIEYRRSVLPGEEVAVHTWITTMEKRTSVRKFEIRNPDATVLYARGETNWAFIDTETKSLCRIPLEVSSAFVIVEK